MGTTGVVILFVDDEQYILDAFERIFRKKPYKVITTSSPTEAVEIVKTREIAVVVSDYRMPEKNGIEVLSQVKLLSPHSIRIMLSGYSDINLAIRAINEIHIFKYLTKPWHNAELSAIIEEAVTEYQNRISMLNQNSDSKKLAYINLYLRDCSIETILAFSQIIELKDKFTKGHCDRVSGYALQIGQRQKLNSDALLDLKYASLLHDIGNIGIPAYILNKDDELTEQETCMMQKHSEYGMQIVSKISSLQKVARIIWEHHERIDGGGYPCGKKSPELLLESKILAIADSFDAMTTDRAYRSALSFDQGMVILQENRNLQFDAEFVDLFVDIIRAGRKAGAEQGQE